MTAPRCGGSMTARDVRVNVPASKAPWGATWSATGGASWGEVLHGSWDAETSITMENTASFGVTLTTVINRHAVDCQDHGGQL